MNKINTVEDVQLLEFEQHGDERGRLIVIEGEKNIPFEIKRVFYIYGSDAKTVRGQHANRRSAFVLINIAGSSKVRVRDAFGGEREFYLDRPHTGLHIPPLVWKDMYAFSPDSVLLVLSSEHYDADEYVRDYALLHEIAQAHNDTGGGYIPFPIKRVYYICNVPAGEQRGFHAHKTLQQYMLCLGGSCTVLLDDSSERREYHLREPKDHLIVTSCIWREMYDFSSGAALIVLASEKYNEADYIRNYQKFTKYVKN